MLLSVEDLFVAGLGFDIAGAFLVSRGLLAPAPRIAQKATTYWGGSPHTMISAAEDRVAGSIGLVSLVVGFILQAAAYTLVIGGSAIGHPGLARVPVAIGVACVPVLAVVLTERCGRAELVRRTVVDSARWDPNAATMRALPSGETLYMIGYRGKGIPRLDGEDDSDYAKRVWKVNQIAPPGMFER